MYTIWSYHLALCDYDRRKVNLYSNAADSLLSCLLPDLVYFFIYCKHPFLLSYGNLWCSQNWSVLLISGPTFPCWVGLSLSIIQVFHVYPHLVDQNTYGYMVWLRGFPWSYYMLFTAEWVCYFSTWNTGARDGFCCIHPSLSSSC